jgi:hypothetical protein
MDLPMLPDVLLNVVLNPPPQASWIPTIVPAVTGIAGTILGGIVIYASNYFLERRRERSAAQLRMDIRRNEKKRVARLLSSDLYIMAARCSTTIEKKEYPRRPLDFTLLWDSYKDIIAVETTDEAWMEIVVGVKSFNAALSFFATAFEMNLSRPDEAHVSLLIDYRDMLRHAKDRVDELMK